MIKKYEFKIANIYPFLEVVSVLHNTRHRKVEIDACIDRAVFEGFFREPLVIRFILSTDEQIKKLANVDLSRLDREKLSKFVKEHSLTAVCVSGSMIVQALDRLKSFDHPEVSEVGLKVLIFFDVSKQKLESDLNDLFSHSGMKDMVGLEFLSQVQFDYLRLRFDAQNVLAGMQELIKIRPEFGAYRIGNNAARVALKKEFLSLQPVFIMSFITIFSELDNSNQVLFGNWIRSQSFHRSLQDNEVSAVCTSSGFVLNNLKSFLSLKEELHKRFELSIYRDSR